MIVSVCWLFPLRKEITTATRDCNGIRVAFRGLLHAGQREVFFDGTQREISGKYLEGAALNYNRDAALSWQTLRVGPRLTDSDVGSPKDVDGQLLPMLQHNRCFWNGCRAHCSADTGRSAGA